MLVDVQLVWKAMSRGVILKPHHHLLDRRSWRESEIKTELEHFFIQQLSL